MTDPTATPPALLPCPFCGAEPAFDDDPDGCGGTVECVAEQCPVRPSVYCDHEEHSRGFRLAVEAWNERAGAPGDLADRIRNATYDDMTERHLITAELAGIIAADLTAAGFRRATPAPSQPAEAVTFPPEVEDSLLRLRRAVDDVMSPDGGGTFGAAFNALDRLEDSLVEAFRAAPSQPACTCPATVPHLTHYHDCPTALAQMGSHLDAPSQPAAPLDPATAELPPEGHPLRMLGERLSDWLIEEQWSEAERLVLEAWQMVAPSQPQEQPRYTAQEIAEADAQAARVGPIWRGGTQPEQPQEQAGAVTEAMHKAACDAFWDHRCNHDPDDSPQVEESIRAAIAAALSAAAKGGAGR